MTEKKIINWLLKGDVSIQYQVYRDLFRQERPDLKKRIETEGWGKKFLSRRSGTGHWGRGFYQPKWISSHYTLLDLKNLGISENCEAIRESLGVVIRNHKCVDGGLNPAKTIVNSDVCVNGMALNYFTYFQWDSEDLKSIVDFLLSQQMKDGGFNCFSNQQGARHSSLHSTLSVLEGILEYRKNHYTYRLDELIKVENESREFILCHRLYKSDKTGEIIDRKMLNLVYPPRWKYDILRALDYFQASGTKYDARMDDAREVLMKKRKNDGRWNLQAGYPGATHFDMEKAGEASRWNTLRAMRILKHLLV